MATGSLHQCPEGNFVPLNGFDNVLHLLLGVGMVALALIFTNGHAKVRA